MLDILRDLRAATPDSQTRRKCTSLGAIHFSLMTFTWSITKKPHNAKKNASMIRNASILSL